MKRKRKPQDELKIKTDFYRHELDPKFSDLMEYFHKEKFPGYGPLRGDTGLDEFQRLFYRQLPDDSHELKSTILLNMMGQGRNYEQERIQLMKKIFPKLPVELSLQIAEDAWGNVRDRDELERVKDWNGYNEGQWGRLNGSETPTYEEIMGYRWASLDRFKKENKKAPY